VVPNRNGERAIKDRLFRPGVKRYEGVAIAAYGCINGGFWRTRQSAVQNDHFVRQKLKDDF
jgi:hypothetical protein